MQTIDARAYAPKDKHPNILSMFLNLKIGESMLLVNDHDPKPLYYQFTAEYPNTFTWTYQESGPEVYKVVIKKIMEVSNHE